MLRFLSGAPRWRMVACAGLLAIVLLAAGAAWRVHAAAEAVAAAESSNGVGILLRLADDAQREHRLVAPEGNNAFEFYFSVLQLDPRNQTALDNLGAAFKPACVVVEQAVAAGRLDEAQRELQLLRAYDAGNYQYDPARYVYDSSDYQLALLGGYLDAQRIVLSRRHAQEAERIRAGAATAAR